MPDQPLIILLSETQGDELAKRLWTVLPSTQYRVSIYNDAAEIEAVADRIAMVVANLADVSSMVIEAAALALRHQVCPPELIGLTTTSVTDRTVFDLCDDLISLDQLEDTTSALRLKHHLRRGLGRVELMNERQMLGDIHMAFSRSREAYLAFDHNRRLMFASNHYRYIDGLLPGVDADLVFMRLSRENDLDENDQVFHDMKKFWASMDGQAVFVMENGMVMRMRAEPLPEGHGTMILTSDITKSVRQEKEIIDKTTALETALQKEREANQLQRQFISMVSHEFRTPLSIIDGNAQLIDRHIGKEDSESVLKRTRTIRSAVSRLIQMMEGVLSSNLLRTGQIAMNREDCDLATLITHLCAEQRELSPNNTIHVNVDGLPPVLSLDPKLMTQIVTNLLSNAVKYGGENPVVDVSAFIADGQLVIKVVDNGVGIPEEEKYRIFDRFFRASTSSGVSGTGIGLSLVREMVDLHDGRIDVDSRVGHGTTFTIYLPISGSVGVEYIKAGG